MTIVRDGAGSTLTKWDYGYGLYGSGPYGGPTPFASHLQGRRTTHTILHHRLVVTVNGVPTIAMRADATHSVRRYTGIASFTVPLPLASHLYDPATEKLLHQTVEIKAGHDETAIRTIFSGRITDDSGTVSDRGRSLTINADGWTRLLDKEQLNDLTFPGGTGLADIFRALCALVGVPKYRADDFTAPDGTAITLGGNPDVDGGTIVVPKSTTPLAWLNRKAGLYGYAVFDVPDGTVVFKRVSGSPVGDVVATYTEGVDPFQFGRRRSLGGLANYIKVTGASYTDSDGIPVEITSIADTVPEDPLLDGGYAFEAIRDTDIVTQAQADIVRNVAEIDKGSPTTEYTWDIVGDSTLAPGDVVTIDFPTVNASGDQWLTDLRQVSDDRGYTATLTGWSGGGEALPAGSDLVVLHTEAGPIHLGDEYVAWYAHPTKQGKTYDIPITVPEAYTALVIEYEYHSSNSYMIGGTSADSTVSKIIALQNSEELGSVEMPVDPERYEQQPDFTLDSNWKHDRRQVPGSQVEAGQLIVRIASGRDARLPDATAWDDLEIRNLTVSASGAGVPALPGGAT